MMGRLALATILLACWAAPAAGQPPGQPRPRQVRIDPLTASIHGRVTTADTGAPIRRAEVRAIAETGISRLATTDADGRFELRDMPAATYRLAVSKSGFVPLYYGQRRPFETTGTITLAEGQRFAANVALPRGAAIAGRVYDANGEPLVEARVQALRARSVDGRPRLVPIGVTDVTDDTGAFRLYGLPPGEYFVAATPVENNLPNLPRGAVADVMPVRNPAAGPRLPVFHPATYNVADAQRVAVDVGGEARADIQVAAIGGVNVSGVVLDTTGAPVADALVSLRSESMSIGFAGAGVAAPPLAISGHAGPTGEFVLTNVPPGNYSLYAQGQLSAGSMEAVIAQSRAQIERFERGGITPTMALPPLIPESGEMPVSVGDAGVTGLTITTGRSSFVEGTIVADTGVSRPLPRVQLQLRSASVSGVHMSMGSLSPAGSFRLYGPSGFNHLVLEGLPQDWALKAIVADGVDVTDQPLDLRNGRSVNVRLILTDRVTSVTGTVIEERSAGRASEEAVTRSVVIFPEDAGKWSLPSRYLRILRTDDGGGFRSTGLPPNERYLAVAVDFLEDGEGTDPEFLERMKPRATAFSLAEGEQRRLDLRVIGR